MLFLTFCGTEGTAPKADPETAPANGKTLRPLINSLLFIFNSITGLAIRQLPLVADLLNHSGHRKLARL
jgi:hypothetical protein